MTQDGFRVTEIDTSRPHPARIYDYLLGGKDNYAVDQRAGDELAAAAPEVRIGLQANRAFLRRAVRYVVGTGVRQILDIGTGLPTSPNVHEVAQEAAPGVRVAYVDNDPIVAAHANALLSSSGTTSVVLGDLRDPRAVVDHPEVRRTIDFDEPVSLLLVAVLHFLEDSDDPYAAVAELRDALAPGSLLVLTHASYEGIPLSQEVAAGTVGVYRDIRNPLVMRSREQIGRFFDGFELVEPGVVSMPLWQPEGTEDPEGGETPEDPYAFSGFGGVGRKA